MSDMLCYICGHKVGWDASEMVCDVGGTDEDDTAVVNFYTCPHCGAFIEVYECSDEDKKDYDFRKERQQDGT